MSTMIEQENKIEHLMKQLLVYLNLSGKFELSEDPAGSSVHRLFEGINPAYKVAVLSKPIKVRSPEDLRVWILEVYEAIDKSPAMTKKTNKILELEEEIIRLNKYETYYKMKMDLNHGVSGE